MTEPPRSHDAPAGTPGAAADTAAWPLRAGVVSGYVLLWEFHVRDHALREFEDAYGPEGDWARLFQRAAGFLRTDLLRDPSAERRYLTADHWASAQAYYAFRAAFMEEYRALDARCQRLTEHETFLGSFDLLAAAHAAGR